MTERKHATISPSSAKRVGFCPASVLLSRDVPESDRSSVYAEEGSRAHAYAENTLLWHFAPLCGAEAPAELGVPEETEMREAVEDYHTHVRCVLDAEGVSLEPLGARIPADAAGDLQFMGVECRIPVDSVTTEADAFGTADCVVVGADTLHVIDFKYGKGVQVEAEENYQLAIYALGFLDTYDPDGLIYGVEHVCLHIVQPRIQRSCTWNVERTHLETRFKPRFKEAAQRALHLLAHPAELRMSAPFVKCEIDDHDGDFPWLDNPMQAEACQFCPAKGTCPWRQRCVNKALAEDFEDLPAEVKPAELTPAVVTVLDKIPVPDTPEAVSKAFGFAGLVEEWAKEVRARALGYLQSGTAVPGLKLVAGRPGPRKWRDEAEAEKALGGYLKKSEAYELKLISPTSAEKLVKKGVIGERKWRAIEELITRSEPKPVVAVESDPRPAIASTLENDFE